MKIMRAFELIRKNGVVWFTRRCWYRLVDNYYEKYFGVDTKGLVTKENLGIHHHESKDYDSVYYRHTINILNKIPVNRNTSTLLDYGCGKGRVIIAAAAYQYKSLLGVELSSLINIAENNISKMRHRKTKNIVLVQGDAQDFKIPSDVNIIYFYNPFEGSILENVVRNIYSSYEETPRKIYIIYFNNDHFDKVVSHQAWLTKIYQSTFFGGLLCGIYETTS